MQRNKTVYARRKFHAGRKCGLTAPLHRIELTSDTRQRGQHDDQHRPESSGQKHHALGVDRKSPKELLGLVTQCAEKLAL